MENFIHTTYAKLKPGDEFAWVSSIDSKVIPYERYILTGNKENGELLEFYNKNCPTFIYKNYNTQKQYAQDRLILIIKKTKEETLLDKIKYLDKRYQERKVNVQN